MSPKPCPVPTRLISVRAAVILTIASLAGTAGGVLTYLSSQSLAQALLAAGTAIGGATGLLNQIVGACPTLPAQGSDGLGTGDRDGNSGENGR